MAIKQRAPQRLKQMLKSCGARVDARVREQLAVLPAGWSRSVSGMFARVERILTDEERQTFRWTEVRDRDGRLAASWSVRRRPVRTSRSMACLGASRRSHCAISISARARLQCRGVVTTPSNVAWC